MILKRYLLAKRSAALRKIAARSLRGIRSQLARASNAPLMAVLINPLSASS